MYSRIQTPSVVTNTRDNTNTYDNMFFGFEKLRNATEVATKGRGQSTRTEV
jgi:hypothetical protein